MKMYDNDVFGMIKDGILVREVPYTVNEWIDALRGWKDTMGDEFIEKIVDAMVNDKWGVFKKGLLDFIEKYGYGDSEDYEKLSELSEDYIAGCFDFFVLWSSRHDECIHVTYYDQHDTDKYDLYDEKKAKKFMMKFFKEKMWRENHYNIEFSVSDQFGWDRYDLQHKISYYEGKITWVA